MLCRPVLDLLSRVVRTSISDGVGGATVDPVRGIWRLVSYSAKDVDTGEIVYPYGKGARGYLMYGAGGRMSALVTAEHRKPLSSGQPSLEERADAFSTCTAYMGHYRWEGDRVVHEVDVALNQGWIGVEQVRAAKIEGTRLTLTTPPQPTSPDGKLRVGTLVWERAA